NTEEDGYKNTSFSFNGGVKPSDLFEINLTANYSDSEYDMDGFPVSFSTFEDTDETTSSNIFNGHLEGVFHLLKDRWQTALGVSLTNIDRDYPDSAWAQAFEGKKIKYELKNRFELSSQQIFILGAETETETAETDSGIDENTTTNAIYLQDQISIGSFNTTVGVRYDHHDDFGTETTWRVAAGYTVKATGSKLKASIGTGFKAPSLYQLFDTWNGNQNLEAETSLGYDIGIEQSLFDHRMILQAIWFHNDIDDYIQWDGGGYQNAGDITTQGVETSLNLYPSELFDFSLSYTYTDTEDENGDRLRRRPLHKGNLDFNLYPMDGKQITINLLYVGDRDESTETLDTYTLVNLAASHQITANLKGFIRIDNLFDEDYEEVSGYGTAGLSGYAGIKLSF
ncbi:MAG: TonB-dependent receptor, partial [Desulfuromonadales bacterium]|nr:TonB-dependent receptor [Desulfuromonadales bacterium]